jgi:hypothetical protein
VRRGRLVLILMPTWRRGGVPDRDASASWRILAGWTIIVSGRCRQEASRWSVDNREARKLL